VGLTRCDDLDSIPIHCVIGVIAAQEVTRGMASTAWVRGPYAIRVRAQSVGQPPPAQGSQSEGHPGRVLPPPLGRGLRHARILKAPPSHTARILLDKLHRGRIHLNDVTFVYRVFPDGELFIFAADQDLRAGRVQQRCDDHPAVHAHMCCPPGAGFLAALPAAALSQKIFVANRRP
jgi:hypothetical protein